MYGKKARIKQSLTENFILESTFQLLKKSPTFLDIFEIVKVILIIKIFSHIYQKEQNRYIRM